VSEANPSESEFLVLNRNSLYPVFPWIAKWRFRCARGLPDSIFAGLRAADGSWLSMIGGRPRNRITYVDWQMNVKAFPALSIGTAMRAYLIEHEVARGTQLLTFEDGTTHSMNRAFVREVVCDLLLARPSLSPNVLRYLAARMPLKSNVLATTIRKGSTVWHSADLRATHEPIRDATFLEGTIRQSTRPGVPATTHVRARGRRTAKGGPAFCGSPTCIANLARAYALSGRRSEALKLLNGLKTSSTPGFSHASEIAAIYVSLGDKDEAMNWLEKGYAERFNPGVLIRPGFDPLRSDPRFQNLVHRVGLPR
jgi:hypothetical protein